MNDSPLASVIWYATWPILIFLVYRLVLIALKSSGTAEESKEEK